MSVFAASAHRRRVHRRFREAHPLETHGPLGTLIAGLGLGAFYAALIWVNLLLGHMLTPLFLIPLTWLQDKVLARRRTT
jgi:hypothetical protein